MNRFLTVKEAAREVRVSESMIRRRVDLGEITVVRLGSRVLIEPQDLEAWVQRNKKQAIA